MPDATFACPDLNKFCSLDELGLVVVGQRREPDRMAPHQTGDKYVTLIIDLIPIRDGTRPARLLDVVEGHAKQAFKT